MFEKKIKRNILLNPGPATTSDNVKFAQVVPDICPREVEFITLMKGIRVDLLKIINADFDMYTSVLFGGSGTSIMESVIASVVDKEKQIVILINGAYGERMKKIAGTYKIHYKAFEYEWGTPIDFNEVEIYLKVNPNVCYIAMVHHETTTGILNPIKKLSEIGIKYNCDTILDAISSYAGMPIDFNETPVDYLMSTSNKCIQGMAGLAFAICNIMKIKNLKNIKSRSYYLSLYDQYDYFEKTGQMRFTPPVQVTYALKQAVKDLFNEGLEARFSRYFNNWKILKDGLINIGFKLLLKPEHESNILITIMEPSNPEYKFKVMHDLLYRNGFTIYPGKLKNDKTFRLSIIGDIDQNDINNFLKCLKRVLIDMKLDKIKY